MTLDTMAPLRFDVSAVAANVSEPLHDPAIDRLVDFFRNKGLEQLKKEDREVYGFTLISARGRLTVTSRLRHPVAQVAASGREGLAHDANPHGTQ